MMSLNWTVQYTDSIWKESMISENLVSPIIVSSLSLMGTYL